jgi:hypothetical protein
VRLLTRDGLSVVYILHVTTVARAVGGPTLPAAGEFSHDSSIPPVAKP